MFYELQADWDAVSSAALALFAFGQKEASKRGLLLVDTKYEFGKDEQGKQAGTGDCNWQRFARPDACGAGFTGRAGGLLQQHSALCGLQGQDLAR